MYANRYKLKNTIVVRIQNKNNATYGILVTS